MTKLKQKLWGFADEQDTSNNEPSISLHTREAKKLHELVAVTKIAGAVDTAVLGIAALAETSKSTIVEFYNYVSQDFSQVAACGGCASPPVTQGAPIAAPPPATVMNAASLVTPSILQKTTHTVMDKGIPTGCAVFSLGVAG